LVAAVAYKQTVKFRFIILRGIAAGQNVAEKNRTKGVGRLRLRTCGFS
jgi:hypothetical protein